MTNLPRYHYSTSICSVMFTFVHLCSLLFALFPCGLWLHLWLTPLRCYGQGSPCGPAGLLHPFPCLAYKPLCSLLPALSSNVGADASSYPAFYVILLVGCDPDLACSTLKAVLVVVVFPFFFGVFLNSKGDSKKVGCYLLESPPCQLTLASPLLGGTELFPFPFV